MIRGAEKIFLLVNAYKVILKIVLQIVNDVSHSVKHVSILKKIVLYVMGTLDHKKYLDVCNFNLFNLCVAILILVIFMAQSDVTIFLLISIVSYRG